ncbi:MAG TPA: hypothetical protein PLT31_05860 [Fibrobacteraceae bacterium]|nr:hypothetical protein [Fibrobacteraceae bacterium]
MRQFLGKGIKIRKIPELQFVLDENLEHALHIDSILADLKNQGDLD